MRRPIQHWTKLWAHLFSPKLQPRFSRTFNRRCRVESLEPRNLLTVVTIAAPDSQAGELNDPGLFVIQRDSVGTQPLTVTYSLAGSTASTSDYRLIGSATIPAGALGTTFRVLPINDGTRENAETLIMTLTSGSSCCGGSPAYTVGSQSTATVTIADNDQWDVAVAAQGSPSEQNGVGGEFVFTRTGESDLRHPLTISYAINSTSTTATTSDYTFHHPAGSSLGSVTIPAWSTSATVRLTPYNDDLRESVETVAITVNSGGYSIGSGSASLSIADNDQWEVSITASQSSAAERSTPGQFVLTRTGSSDLRYGLSVPYTTSGTATHGSDYSYLSGYWNYSFYIPPGQTSLVVDLLAQDDGAYESAETAVVTLSAPPGTNPTYALGASTATVTIAASASGYLPSAPATLGPST